MGMAGLVKQFVDAVHWPVASLVQRLYFIDSLLVIQKRAETDR